MLKLRLYAANLLATEAILEPNKHLRLFDYRCYHTVSDENLGISDFTWVVLFVVEQEHDTTPFFASIRNIYLSSIKKKC